MSDDIKPPAAVAAAAERLIALLLDSYGNQKAKLTLFVGAGVSREYGIPTTLEFAQRFFADAISGVRQAPPPNDSPDERAQEIKEFIKTFREKLDADVAYAFFRRIEEESIAASPVEEILTYDRILDLWRNGFVKIVITTNFDSLIERKLAAYTKSSGDESFRLAVVDYNDLARDDRARIIDGRFLVKIAGQIDRSNMLWTEEDFRSKLTEPVISWLNTQIADTPILLLGYTASEQPLAELLASHKLYAVSVAPRPLQDIPTLANIAERRQRPLDHVESTAGKLVEAIYERLFERTRNPNLVLSYKLLSERVTRLSNLRLSTRSSTVSVRRWDLENQIRSFMISTDQGNRCLLIIGESGMGKTTLLLKAATISEQLLTIYIPAAEVTTSLDNWCHRLGGVDLHHICRLTRLLGRSLIIVIDGLNEVSHSERARDILNELLGMLDHYDAGNVRAIISCRMDYWNRMKLNVDRIYLASIIQVSKFSEKELDGAIEDLGARNELKRARWAFLVDLLRVPQNFSYYSELRRDHRIVASEHHLLSTIFSQRLNKVPDASRVLAWLCGKMRDAHQVSLPLEDLRPDTDMRSAVIALADVGLLKTNRFSVTRFAEDRMAEFVFGSLFLYEYLWRSLDADAGGTVQHFFTRCVAEYESIRVDEAAFKSLFLNAMLFFLVECTDDELELLYRHGTNFQRTLLRAAAVLRRRLTLSECYQDDPVLVAVSLLGRNNFPGLVERIQSHEDYLLSGLPFGFSAKLFPESFLDFIEFLVEQIGSEAELLSLRQHYSALVNSLLIYVLRNGPQELLSRPILIQKLRQIVKNAPLGFLAARIFESLESNSRYLFHSHPTAKLSQLEHMEWYWRSALLRAIDETIYVLSISDLCSLIKQHPAVRMVVRFIFIRDVRDRRFPEVLATMFSVGDLFVQDFCMGLLGWAGKIDKSYVELSEHYVIKMQVEYPQNFYRFTLDDPDAADSQYDPLVPHITTLLRRGLPINLQTVIQENSARSAYRIGKLLQKTILDFPNETLDLIYDFLKTETLTDEIKVALRIAARLFPVSFWERARQEHPKFLFEISGDNFTEIERIVAQVRDNDWCNIYAFIDAAPERGAALTIALRTMLGCDNTEDYLKTLLQAFIAE
jgi:hypothetical protein